MCFLVSYSARSAVWIWISLFIGRGNFLPGSGASWKLAGPLPLRGRVCGDGAAVLDWRIFRWPAIHLLAALAQDSRRRLDHARDAAGLNVEYAQAARGSCLGCAAAFIA